MPNWCENRLSVSGPEATVAAIVDAVKLKEGQFDCNGIVPMPESLKITKGSTTMNGQDVLFGNWESVLERFKKMFEEASEGSLPSTREEMILLLNERTNERTNVRLRSCVT
jgi:hypothetical protein